jgi:enolase-like protein
VNGFAIEETRLRLCRVPVDPPRGDAIQQFDALELPIVELVDAAGRSGIGFGYSPAAFHDAVHRGALDILQPDVARAGGITAALTVCRLAEAANLRVAPHVSPELSIAVAAAVPNAVFVEYIPQMEPILARPLVRRDGYGIPFDVPGHGIEFSPDALEKFTVWTDQSSSSPAHQPA